MFFLFFLMDFDPLLKHPPTPWWINFLIHVFLTLPLLFTYIFSSPCFYAQKLQVKSTSNLSSSQAAGASSSPMYSPKIKKGKWRCYIKNRKLEKGLNLFFSYHNYFIGSGVIEALRVTDYFLFFVQNGLKIVSRY